MKLLRQPIWRVTSTAILSAFLISLALLLQRGNGAGRSPSLLPSGAEPPTVPGRALGRTGSPPAPVLRYTIRDLGPPGSRFSKALAVNASGDVVGYAVRDQQPTCAFLCVSGNEDSSHRLPLTPAWAYAINDAGHLAGRVKIPGGAYRAFLYRDGVPRDLGTLGGALSTAYGINNRGDVVGEAQTAGNAATHAFLYTHGVMHDLGTLGGDESQAAAMNDAGEIVGASRTRGNWSIHAFLYRNGKMEDLGTLGGSDSEARALNEAGEIVGVATTAEGADHAFLYRRGVIEDLGTLSGGSSVAEDVNNAGEVVGACADGAGGMPGAFLYRDGVMLDLNRLIPPSLGWHLIAAQAINGAGQIVGWGNFGGRQRAFLLTPERVRGGPVR